VLRAWPFAIVAAAVIAVYLMALGENPPGFNFDESSVAYNAYAIARDGRDEHGVRFPLFFEAFGEYKNPVSIYLLAGVFEVVDPGTRTARAVSALLGVATVLAMARLAWNVTRDRTIALIAMLAAAATPMIFEISRLVLEAAVFPLAVALFLLAARAAHDREEWSPALIAALAATLALVTYSYTAGRLLGPLFALLLGLFVTRRRLRGWIVVLVLYGVTLIPAAIFNERHPGAFLQHARDVAVRGTTGGEVALAVARNYVLNLDPVNLALIGDPNARHHVSGSGGSVLVMSLVLAAAGAWMTRRTRWTQFLLLGALASILPGALANGVANTLRLSGLIVFLLALGFAALRGSGAFVSVLLVIGIVQAAWFFTVFVRDGANRPEMFDAGARPAMEAAIARGQRPIYVEGRLYSHAYWFGALHGVDRSQLRLLAPREHAPGGAVVFSDSYAPKDVTTLARQGRFAAYIAP
jgi:4-amino-4-deoxy-L-arabinose transferase-like glycosyltransferase